MNQRQITLPPEIDLAALFGSFDANLKLLEKSLAVTIAARENVIKISGEDDCIDKAAEVLEILLQVTIIRARRLRRKRSDKRNISRRSTITR